jgi:hypothetical protein
VGQSQRVIGGLATRYAPTGLRSRRYGSVRVGVRGEANVLRPSESLRPGRSRQSVAVMRVGPGFLGRSESLPSGAPRLRQGVVGQT